MKEKFKMTKGEIIKVAIIALVLIWIIIFFIDYFRARSNIKEYSDGSVYTCTGLGYKMYKYDRTSINMDVEFGPFFMKERTK
mgnify:CR=1 FL=1